MPPGRPIVPLLEETIGANLERTVATYPRLRSPRRGRHRAAMDLRGVRCRCQRLARGLLAGGIAAGDRIGMWSPNCAEWVLVQYATAKVGAILVNINPAYRTHELTFVLNQSGVRWLISATEFKTSDYRAMIDEVRPECPSIERVVFVGTATSMS